MSKVFDLWNEVGRAFGPSGREDAVRAAIAAKMCIRDRAYSACAGVMSVESWK